jgi:hypothetical protein
MKIMQKERKQIMETMTYQPEIGSFVEHLFDEEIRLTGITEYGISWKELIEGNAEIPVQGARFDLSFEGKVTGSKVNGVIKGIDYLEIRSDGKFTLNIHARIITEDGEIISVKENGISTPGQSGVAKLNLNMEFLTTSSNYSWLNRKQVWVVGEVDMINGEVKAAGFSSN